MASSEYNKAYYAKNRERMKERAREYYHANKEACQARGRKWYHANKVRARENSKRWHEKNKEYVAAKSKITHRRGMLARQYGLTEEAYGAMLDSQGGVCAICEKLCDVAPNLSVDHSHDSGEVRGLLCRRCNSGLGFFRENADFLARAAAYLTKPEVPNVA